MPGPRSLEYGRIKENTTSTYGTVPSFASGTSVLQADEYSIEPENTVVNQEKFVGEFDVTNQDIEQQDLRGSIVMQAWPENISLLLQMAGIKSDEATGRNETTGAMREYAVQWHDPAAGATFQHNGLLCDVCRIEIRPNESLRFSYDMVGQTESTVADFDKPSMITRAAFKMSDAHSTSSGRFNANTGTEDAASDGTNEPNFIEGTIEIRNNLQPSPPRNNGMNIIWIDTGVRNVSFTCRIRTNSADQAKNYKDAVRTRAIDFGWDFLFNYPGTGSPFDSLQISMNRCSIVRANRTGGTNESQVLDCAFEVAKPAAEQAIVATLS